MKILSKRENDQKELELVSSVLDYMRAHYGCDYYSGPMDADDIIRELKNKKFTLQMRLTPKSSVLQSQDESCEAPKQE